MTPDDLVLVRSWDELREGVGVVLLPSTGERRAMILLRRRPPTVGHACEAPCSWETTDPKFVEWCFEHAMDQRYLYRVKASEDDLDDEVVETMRSAEGLRRALARGRQ